MGQVKSVDVTATGVRAVLAMRSGVKVPSDIQASVHSRSAIGEQYIELTPQPGKDGEHSRPLRAGDVIPAGHVDVPVDIGHLLDLTNRALQAIPRDNLHTVIDETNRAVGGLGPELSRIVDGSTALAIAGGRTVDPLATLIDQSPAVLNSQVQTSDAIATWADRTAAITAQFKAQDAALRDLLTQGTSGLEEGRALLDRVAPALPVLFANLVSLGDIAVVYRHDIEQLLVLLPQGIAVMSAALVPNSGHQTGVPRLLSGFQPQPQLAAAMHYRLPAAHTASLTGQRGRAGPAGGRPVLPGAAGLGVQCPWGTQHSV